MSAHLGAAVFAGLIVVALLVGVALIAWGVLPASFRSPDPLAAPGPYHVLANDDRLETNLNRADAQGCALIMPLAHGVLIRCGSPLPHPAYPGRY